jgi:hypothetical protein
MSLPASSGVQSAGVGDVPKLKMRESSMTHKPEDAAIEEEIILPENLLPLGSILGEGITPLDVSMVLAKVFRVQYAEVALLRLDGGLLKFIFPEHLRTTGAIPISSKAVAAHTALSKKAEIFNNFARVKHASIFETIKPVGTETTDEPAAPAPIQKLMSVPILDQNTTVLGVLQISRKGLDPKFTQDFSREDLHDLELAAGLLAASPVMQSN